MTRRIFVFVDAKSKKLFMSPEFNGDRKELEQRISTSGCLDSCDVTIEELYDMFRVRNLDDFWAACAEAQRYFHSFLDKPGVPKELLPVTQITLSDLPQIFADYLIFVLEGGMITAPSGWDGTLKSLYETVSTAGVLAQALGSLDHEQESGTLEYSQRITISKLESNIIQSYLNARSEDEFQGVDSTITHTIYFPDGMSMDIKCCGCQDDSSWTEAVLFDQNGNQVACTEVCDNYDGTWELEYGGIIHRAIVSMEKGDADSGFLADAEGICPVCGAEIEYDGCNEVDDDGGLIPWHCPSCGATGSEGYNRAFDRHYNVCSADGKPVPSRETSTYKEDETHD